MWEAEERMAEEVLAGAEDSPLDVRLTSSGTPLVGIGHLVIRMPSFKLKINPGGCLTPTGGGAESDDESGERVEGLIRHRHRQNHFYTHYRTLQIAICTLPS